MRVWLLLLLVCYYFRNFIDHWRRLFTGRMPYQTSSVCNLLLLYVTTKSNGVAPGRTRWKCMIACYTVQSLCRYSQRLAANYVNHGIIQKTEEEEEDWATTTRHAQKISWSSDMLLLRYASGHAYWDSLTVARVKRKSFSASGLQSRRWNVYCRAEAPRDWCGDCAEQGDRDRARAEAEGRLDQVPRQPDVPLRLHLRRTCRQRHRLSASVITPSRALARADVITLCPEQRRPTVALCTCSNQKSVHVIFGTQSLEEIWRTYEIAHHTWSMSAHFLVKYKNNKPSCSCKCTSSRGKCNRKSVQWLYVSHYATLFLYFEYNRLILCQGRI